MSIVYDLIDNVPWMTGIELYIKSFIVIFKKIIIHICLEQNPVRVANLQEYLFIFLLCRMIYLYLVPDSS